MSELELSIEGANESRSVIKRFHQLLNNPNYIPEQAYRRNSGSYPLVSYVNNITGLFLSKNYQVIPTFIARASEHLDQYPPSVASQAYYSLVRSYLCHMAFHLSHFIDQIEFDHTRVPLSILQAGPQQPPTA